MRIYGIELKNGERLTIDNDSNPFEIDDRYSFHLEIENEQLLGVYWSMRDGGAYYEKKDIKWLLFDPFVAIPVEIFNFKKAQDNFFDKWKERWIAEGRKDPYNWDDKMPEVHTWEDPYIPPAPTPPPLPIRKDSSATLCESPIEVKMLEALGKHLPCLIPQYETLGYRLDFALLGDGIKIAIECDGHDFHERTKEQAAKDKSRDRKLSAAGWTVLRFTGSEIHNHADRCAAEVMEIVSAKRAGNGFRG